MDDNVVQLPTRLERLATTLQGYLERDIKIRKDWIEVKMGICLTLAEARDEFENNADFGQWCADNGFGKDVLNDNDRWAAVNMGREPDALEKCLSASNSISLQMIYRNEFGGFRKPPSRRGWSAVPSPKLGKTKKIVEDQKVTGSLGSATKTPSRPSVPSPKLDKAKKAADELAAEGQPVTARKVAERAGVGRAIAERAVVVKETEAVPSEPLTREEMDRIIERRFDMAVAQAKQAARNEVRAEIYAEMDIMVRSFAERVERAESILANFKGIISADDYRKIRTCLHSDHNTFKYANEAFNLFSSLEKVLVKPEPPVQSGPPLPRTTADLMAQRGRNRR